MNYTKILITLLIIYIPNSLHFPFSFGVKGVNIFNLLYFLLFLNVILGEGRFKRKGVKVVVPLKKAFFLFYMTLIVALLVSFNTSNHFLNDATIFKNVLTYSSLYFIVFYLIEDKDITYYMKIVVLVVFIMGIEILKEAISGGLGSGKRNAAAFGTTIAAANYAGVFFTIFVPFVFKVYISKLTSVLTKYQSLSIYFMGIVGIFYTYSRQSYLSVLITTLLIITKRSKFLLLLFVLMLLNYQVWLPDTVIQRIERTQSVDDRGEEQLDNSTESRLVIWENAFTIIKSNPGGIGFNQFQDKIDPYLPSWIHARDAHNQFVLVTTENGVIGLLALLFLIWSCYRMGHTMSKADNSDTRILGEAYKLMIIAVVIGNLYSSTFYSPEVMGNFWVLSALIARVSIKSNMEKDDVKLKNI